MEWKDKTIDKVFRYFGYNHELSFKNDVIRQKTRDLAISKMSVMGVPDEVVEKAKSFSDEKLKDEERKRARMEEERRRRRLILDTKDSNRRNETFEDDDVAQAVYQHIMEEELDESEIDETEENYKELKIKIDKLQLNIERIEDARSKSGDDDYLLSDLESRVIKLESWVSEYDELEEYLHENDIYAVLYEDTWTHHGLRHFETDYGEFASGTEDESNDAAKESLEGLFDDIGLEGITSWVIEQNINDERLKEDIIESESPHYEEMVRDDLSDYFEDYDEDDEETHPSDDDIDEKAKEMAEDRADELISDFPMLEEYGYEIRDYVDMDGVKEDILQSDGLGNTLSSYDGTEHNISVNDVWYNVYRTN